SPAEQALAWLLDGKHFLVGANPLSIRSLDGKLVEEVKPVPGVNTNSVTAFTLSPDRKTILGKSGGKYFLYDIADKKLAPLSGIRGDSLTFSPDGQYLI